MISLNHFLECCGTFFVVYLLGYATFLLLSVLMGAVNLYDENVRLGMKNELTHEFALPISIIVPAHNEEVTIVDMVESLLALDYRLYEIIVVDDGSQDETAARVIERFGLHGMHRPIRMRLPCAPLKEIYESCAHKVRITLICKENGGKGDSLNMGINAAAYPYFLCVDANSALQADSLSRISQPVLENDGIVAVGGMIRIAQGVTLKDGQVMRYQMPKNPIVGMQVLEYDRSFLASRILLDRFNGNLIVSGAFGLFRKDVVIAAGGYDSDTMGEDMELIVKLHVFCRNNQIKYAIRYAPAAICWSQAPSTLSDLCRQRRRWHLGLFQSMIKYRQILFNPRFGMLGMVSYMYYLLYELLSPFVEMFGIAITLLALVTGLINVQFMIIFFAIYLIYGAILTLTAFLERIHTQNMKIGLIDALQAILLCLLESVFYRFVLAYTRTTAFVGYKKRKKQWGTIKRTKFDEDAAHKGEGGQGDSTKKTA